MPAKWLRRLTSLALLLAAPAGFAETARWTSLNNMAASYGLRWSRADGRQLVLNGPFTRLVFEPGSRRVIYNGLALHLNASVIRQGNDGLITIPDAVNGIGALLRPSASLNPMWSGTVVLDPGHGGDDPGTQDGRRIEEKRLALDLARRVKAKLRACKLPVYLTRDRDATLSLDERCRRAERWGADVFVSIHLNASRDRRTSGIETYVMPAAGYSSTAEPEGLASRADRLPALGNRCDAANMILAHYLHTGLIMYGHAEDRGIRRARFHVIRNVACPAALVECGFLSNRQDAERLSQDAYRDALADGIARGILTYLSRVRESHQPAICSL
jgi:N-acetylmuramoyl-L-alanine amidase